jgi:hypothetical protein
MSVRCNTLKRGLVGGVLLHIPFGVEGLLLSCVRGRSISANFNPGDVLPVFAEKIPAGVDDGDVSTPASIPLALLSGAVVAPFAVAVGGDGVLREGGVKASSMTITFFFIFPSLFPAHLCVAFLRLCPCACVRAWWWCVCLFPLNPDCLLGKLKLKLKYENFAEGLGNIAGVAGGHLQGATWGASVSNLPLKSLSFKIRYKFNFVR